MRSIWTQAAAVLLSVVAPGVAQAADYMTYRFDVSGYASRTKQNPDFSYSHAEGALNSVIEFVVPGNGTVNDFFYAEPMAPRYALDVYAGTLTATSFRVVENTNSYPKGPTRGFEINACGSFGGLTAPVSVAVNPLCSTVTFFRGEPGGINLGGDGASFDGVVTKLTVTAGFGAPIAYGLINAPIIGLPEPASWAMMIGGFGLVGGAMRHRRRSIRLAAV